MGCCVFFFVLCFVIGVSNFISRGDIIYIVGIGGICVVWDFGGGLMMVYYVVIVDVFVDLFVVIFVLSLWWR